MPKSITRLVVDKVKLLYLSEMFLIQSILFDIKVSNKSLLKELNNVLFCSCCCCTDDFTCAGERERDNLMRSGL